MNTTQIVISKLTLIENRDRFIELTREMVAWLKRQPGFLEYTLYENGVNMSDSLVYESEEAANKINEDFRNTDICKSFLTLVDPDYRGFFGKKVSL